MICLLCCSCSFSKSVNIDINKIIQDIISYDNKFNSDFLEYINDNFGHEEGDNLIKAVIMTNYGMISLANHIKYCLMNIVMFVKIIIGLRL